MEELKRCTVLPTIIEAELFLVSHLGADERLLEVSLTDKGRPVNLHRLVKVDHAGNFKCTGGQKACRDHDMAFLRDGATMGGWWGSVAKVTHPEFGPFDESLSFVREVTSDPDRILPIELDGRLGTPLNVLDAAAWLGPRLRLFVVGTGAGPDEVPVVCVLARNTAFCNRCQDQEGSCLHVRRVLTETGETCTAAGGSDNQGGRSLQVTTSLSKKRAERAEFRASGQRRQALGLQRSRVPAARCKGCLHA